MDEIDLNISEISFNPENSKGKLIYSEEGVFSFQGDADKSSKIFLDVLQKNSNNLLSDLQKQLAEKDKELERLRGFKNSVLSNTTNEILTLYHEMQKWDKLLKGK